MVATLDDYDTDREAEQQRVAQMLQDLDESMKPKEGKKHFLTSILCTLRQFDFQLSSWEMITEILIEA